MRVLITGGSGLVGSNLIEHNLSKKHDLLTPSSKELDLMDLNLTRRYLKRNQPQLIIHCAGHVGGIWANMKDPHSFLFKNVTMGSNLISLSYELGIKKLINLASSCIYPKSIKNPLKEDKILSSSLEPTNEGYSLAKIYCLKLCEYISKKNSQFLYRSLIPCNLYGRYDKFDLNSGHMVASAILKVLNANKSKKKIVKIWGSGKVRREFMYAQDLADFIWRNLNNLKKMPNYMNVGCGYDHTIKDYYLTIINKVNSDLKIVYDRSKPDGMKQKLLDISLQKKLDWAPKTNLSQGIDEAIKFCKKKYGI
jgi:GDP-L-fucose synthase